jgi:GT2 family glycosyltransferase
MRPNVSVVVPFAGSGAEAEAVVWMLESLETQPGDELILSDNRGTAPTHSERVRVVRAQGEHSASHARNVGGGHARNDWILFIDSDVRPPADLLEKFFIDPIDERVGVVTGDIVGLPEPRTLAERYGTVRNFLGQRSHVQNPYRPRAASANLLVRRACFEQAGGFTEGIKLAEDTDFTWRIQDLGWTLGFQPAAVVQHAYRSTLRGLGRQWRSYAAGTAWLATQYPDFKPDPGLNRFARILLKRVGIGQGVAFRADGRGSPADRALSRWERAQFLMVQVMLGIEEQIGLRQSNFIAHPATPRDADSAAGDGSAPHEAAAESQ